MSASNHALDRRRDDLRLSRPRASDSRIIVSERDEVDAHAVKLVEQLQQSYEDALGAKGAAARRRPSCSPTGTVVAARLAQATQLVAARAGRRCATEPWRRIRSRRRGRTHVRCQPAVELHGRVADWVAEIRRLRDDGETTLFVAATAGRAERTIELLKEYDVLAVPVERADDARYAAVLVAIGSAVARLPAARRRPADLRRSRRLRGRAPRARAAPLGDQGVSLRPARSQGRRSRRPRRSRHRRVRRPEADRRRRQRCRSSSSSATPATTSCSCRSSGSIWSRSTPARRGRRSIGSAARRGSARRRKVKKAMRDMAEELLKLYAARKAVPGHAFSPDSHWQQEFEDAFEYELTPDQKTAIADIKRDMESPTPMDRLLCGDVGYGKTEVAMRAAFKAVMDGKQVAVPRADDGARVSAPEDAARSASPAFPVRIEMVSRFRSEGGAEGDARPISPPARSTSSSARTGCCRRTSQFRDLGLLVVDEEQRFGVAHKEKIKQLQEEGRRADDERDADSAHAEHVARRHPRHVDHRDAAEGSPVDSDQRRQVRSAGDRRARSAASWRAAARSTSSTTASSRSSRSAT